MAPNKIYMPNELLSEEWQRHIEGEDTEYIRKEALLEWLQQGFDWVKTPYISVQQIIDKINSL